MSTPHVSALLNRKVTAEEYSEIRRLWQIHSIAENRRDLGGLISTLTEECVYELFQTDRRWSGHEGARAFYTELLTAFPDITFELQNIVIGPQGVFEEARATATHLGRWMQQEPSGNQVEFHVLICFPWDPEKRKFRGERIWVEMRSMGKSNR